MSPDAESFERFMVSRSRALGRTAYLLTGNHHDAEDLVQATLINAARHWRTIGDDPEPYVRRILYNEHISRWRRRRSRPDEQLTSAVPDPGVASGLDLDLKLTLQRALARLTRKQRTILVLRYFEDLSESQTASALGIAVGTVKSQTRHALNRLRTLAPDLAELADLPPVDEVG